MMGMVVGVILSGSTGLDCAQRKCREYVMLSFWALDAGDFRLLMSAE